MDTKLEVAMIPVSDVNKAKEFYQGLGWRLDADFDLEGGVRVVQLTPPGSACSVSFGSGIPGGMELVVEDIDAARADLARHGVEVSDAFHREGGKFAPGPDPNRASYNSFASFKDPDGNDWLLQEVTTRLPGRATSPLAVYDSEANLADALRRAAEAHGRQEGEAGRDDPYWANFYAHFLAEESASDTSA